MINKISKRNIDNILSDKWYKAKVVKGKGRGKKLGFPTINLRSPAASSQQPDYKHGVYLCKIKLPSNLITYLPNKLTYFGLLHYGPRSTFKEKKPQLEIYIFNFDSNIKTGSKVKFRLVSLLRKSNVFNNSSDLVKQIKEDVKEANKLIG